MPQFSFGSGNLYAIPPGANPSPVLFGTLQECSIDISFSLKELHGQNQFAVAVGRGAAKITGKAKAATISAAAMNTIFTGTAVATGGLAITTGEIGSVVASAYTVLGAAGFAEDLGVTMIATGVAMTCVASTPVAGVSYTVTSGGVYGFAVTDVGTNNISVSYSANVATGLKSAIITNPLMGAAPVFMAELNVPNASMNTVLNLKLYQCISSKLTMTFKNEDFTVPEFDFSCFANAAGQVYQITTTH